MKKTLTILSIALLFGSLSAQNPDAEYNLIKHHYTLNSDSTIDYNFRKEIKYLRNKAITAYADKGETFILYNPAFETLTINECYTIRPDGTKVETPQNAFINQLPSECTDCGRFNGIREMAIVHTALEINSVVVLDYTIHRKSNILNETLQPQQNCPVKKFEIIVDAPKNESINVQYNKSLQGIQWTMANDTHRYHFVAQNLAQTISESYMPTPEKLYTQVTISNDRVPIHNEALKTIEGADALLNTLKKEKESDYVVAIRDYVIDNINTNNIPLSLLNYEVSPASVTWATNCGTQKDKNLLLRSLLKQAGFSSYFVDESEQTLIVTADGMQQRLSATHKTPIMLYGVARDENPSNSVDMEMPLDTIALADGYYMVKLPMGRQNYNPTMLTSERLSPVQVRRCNETDKYTIQLPKGAKLVGDKIEASKKASGIGEVSISIKQKGNTLEIKRNLVIEKDIISVEDYKDFREIIQIWGSYSQVQLVID